MVAIYLLLTFLSSQAEFSIILITSDRTALSEKQLIESNIEAVAYQAASRFKFDEPVRITFATTNSVFFEQELPILSFIQAGVVLDLTYSPSTNQLISKLSLEKNFLHIIMNQQPNLSQIDKISYNSLGSFMSPKTEARILYSIVEYYGWNNLALIHDDQTNNILIGDYLKEQIKSPKALVTEQAFTISDKYETISSRLLSSIKKTKGRVIFLITHVQLAAKIIRAAEDAGMTGSGYVWIFASCALDGFGEILKNTYKTFNELVMKSGVIGVLPVNNEILKNDPIEIWSSVLSGVFKGIQSTRTFNGSELSNYMRKGVHFDGSYIDLTFDDIGMRTEDYLLINIQDFRQKLVGRWEKNELKIDFPSNIIFPGYSNEAPSDFLVSLYLVLLHPGTNNEEDESILNGFDLAIKTINEDNSILPGYKLQPIYIVPYSTSIVIAGSLNFLENINVIGFIGPWGNKLTKSYINYISSMEHPKPLVSYQASSYLLNSSVEYPYFLRTIQPDGLSAPAIIAFIELMKWKKVAVVYTDDDTGIGTYQSFLENLKSYDIVIKNSKDKRKIHLNNKEGKISSETLDSIDEVLSEIVRKQLKIILFFGSEEITPTLLQKIRKKELYGKEYVWIGSNWLNSHLMLSLKNSSSLDTLQGFMSLSSRPPLGSMGEYFAAEYKKTFNKSSTSYSALTFDSVYLYSNSIKRMIDSGEDFYHVDALMSFLRTADFDSASGTLRFSEGFNDRYMTGYSLLNVQDSHLVEVMQYDPLTSYVADQNTKIKWPGGSSQPSDSWPDNFNCPFPKSMSVSSETGIITIIMIGIGLVIVSFTISLFHYNRSRKIFFEKLKVKEYKTWKDTMVEIMIVVEFLQFLAIAPTFKSLDLFIKVLSNLFMLDIIKITDAESNYYWIMLSAVCSLCFLWFTLMVVVITKKSEILNRIPILKKVMNWIISLFLPFFGNTLFLPTLAFLLDPFVCDHQVLGKAYVWRDCYMTCWTKTHVKYIVLSSFAIILYQPLAIICRPFWQEASKDVHLKTTTTFLLVKTCFQMLLITVGKALQGNFPLVHGIVFTLLVSIFTFTTYKFRAFNYERCDLWELISLISLTYYSTLATLSFIGDKKNVGWVIGLLLGWVIILGTGYGIQYKYFPSLLLTEERQKESGKIHDLEDKVPSLENHANGSDPENADKVMDISRGEFDESRIQEVPPKIISKIMDNQEL